MTERDREREKIGRRRVQYNCVCVTERGKEFKEGGIREREGKKRERRNRKSNSLGNVMTCLL